MTKVLHLTLHRKWFDEIAEGRKVEEYRDKTDFWKRRLENRVYDEVWFRNGYTLDRPFMRVKWNGIREDSERYTILLGDILEIKNY